MKIEINVPTSLSEIALGQYQKFVSITENNTDENFINSKMIEIFCGIPLSDTYKLKMSSVVAITDILIDLLQSTPKDVERFKMNGIEYGRIPDLDEMSLGEYIDLDNNCSVWDSMHIAMNVLYRPVKDSKDKLYNIVEYSTDNPERMKDMPMDAVLSSLFFLTNLGIELSQHTILYSDNQEGAEITQLQQILAENGGGIHHFTDSLKEILDGLKISLN